MVHRYLFFVFTALFISNIFLCRPAAATSLPIIGETTQHLLAFNPSEIGRKMTDSFNQMKAGLHPVIVMLIYIGLVFLGLIVFTAVVIMMFIFIMMLRR